MLKLYLPYETNAKYPFLHSKNQGKTQKKTYHLTFNQNPLYFFFTQVQPSFPISHTPIFLKSQHRIIK
jgi:hypothetical protein